MSVNTLQEELTQRLETFARDQVFTRADAACELLMTLVAREGGFSVDAGGHLLVGGRRMGGTIGEELLELVAIGTSVFCSVFSAGRCLNANPRELFKDAELPAEINTVCVLRGESFIGSALISGKQVMVSAKPLRNGAAIR